MADVAKYIADGITSLLGIAPYLQHYPLVKYGWYFVVALALLLALPTYYALKHDPRRTEIRDTLIVQKRVAKLVDAQSQENPFDLQFIRGSKALLQRKLPAIYAFPGTIYEKKFLDGQREIDLRVMVLHDNAAWQRTLSEDDLEIIGGGTISLQEVLASKSFRDAIGASRHLVGVGLASTAPRENSEGNKLLSSDRALKLCDALAEVTDLSSHKLWRMALGGALESATSKEEQQRQRLVVVIGVEADLSFDPENALNEIVLNTDISGVDLKSYSLSTNPIFEPYRSR